MGFNFFNSNKEEEYKKIIESQNKKIKKLEKTAESHQAMLNNIFVFYKLQPTPFMSTIREVGYQMLKFVDNVCKKHDIQWWVDYGTLLGAVRHQDFVPWDDDLDSGMMRADLNVFMEVIDDEIAENNLEYIRAEYKRDKHTDLKTKRWFQFKYNRPDFYGSFCTLDIFQYDYIKDYNGEDIEETYYECMREWFKYDQYEDMEPHLEKVFEKLNLTLEKDNYIISGVECPRGKIKMYPYKILKAEEVFPLKRIPFGKYDFPVPNHTRDYLKYIYGKNYMSIPNKVRDHKRLNRYVKKDNIIEVLQEEIDLLRKANKNFEK